MPRTEPLEGISVSPYACKYAVIRPPWVKHKWVPRSNDARNFVALSLTSDQDSPPVALKLGSANLAFSLGGKLSKCNPSCSPKFNSLRSLCLLTSSENPVAKKDVSIDLSRSEECFVSNFASDKHSDNLNACFLPKSDRGTSIQPVIVPAKFPYDSQFLTSRTFRKWFSFVNCSID